MQALSRPNPCNKVLNFSFNANDNKEVFFSVYDVTGRRVISNAIAMADQPRLDVAVLHSGFYLLDIYDQNKKIMQRIKFIKEDGF